jgi:uncharacterized protein YkwD
MIRKLFPLLGIFAALAIPAFTQNNTPKVPAGPNSTARLSNLEADFIRYMEMDEDEDEGKLAPSRPRIVEIKSSAVKSSVVVNLAAMSRTAFELINEKRSANGLKPLTWNDDLAKVADLHSRNMAEFSFFSHKGLDSKMVSDRADDMRVGRWRAIGENIAFNRGYADPTGMAVRLWLDSPGHKRNLLSPDWTESAIGVAVTEEGAYYFTQVFMVRK